MSSPRDCAGSRGSDHRAALTLLEPPAALRVRPDPIRLGAALDRPRPEGMGGCAPEPGNGPVIFAHSCAPSFMRGRCAPPAAGRPTPASCGSSPARMQWSGLPGDPRAGRRWSGPSGSGQLLDTSAGQGTGQTGDDQRARICRLSNRPVALALSVDGVARRDQARRQGCAWESTTPGADPGPLRNAVRAGGRRANPRSTAEGSSPFSLSRTSEASGRRSCGRSVVAPWSNMRRGAVGSSFRADACFSSGAGAPPTDARALALNRTGARGAPAFRACGERGSDGEDARGRA